ncbi:hypothetical protein CDL15_Pgr001246 [Punica granatum]|uniref:Aminotransferase class V domain-containing protein n=1 Tax=Punica granatum TaxID=22663 RepID=A0A218WM88_PUNGR|nr:hypothetical protein CDL15_Pgr001246 [Punica granatum]
MFILHRELPIPFSFSFQLFPSSSSSPVLPLPLPARYGNLHSRTHLCGWKSDLAVESARAQVAVLIKASPKEIVLTSGATEGNNISVKGVMHFYSDAAQALGKISIDVEKWNVSLLSLRKNRG